jgi:adenylate cyclase
VPTSARSWLIDGAPGAATSPEVLAGTCQRLVAGGVPVVRAEAYVRTLHPQFAGRAFVWQRDGRSRVSESQHEADLDAASEPIRRVFETREVVRSGRTIALPLRFTSGEVHASSFETDREPTEADIATIEGVMAPLSRMAEILALRRTATNVITAYVGRDAGARVLAGKIRRGDTERIEAAIWFSDMRGFTAMSNMLEPHDVIAKLNELYDCQLPAIERHGGEVLKFMGDGLLAIFVPGDRGLGACCERALAASRDALAAVAARNARIPDTRYPMRFGIALHVGEVAYGNIGGAWRLDFTCIGPAVNLASRLEGLTGQTGHDLLASRQFVGHCRERFVSIGEFALKGFDDKVAAFAPA